MISPARDALDKPVFIISLDTELGWGFILNPKHKVLNILYRDPEQGRGAIDLLLELFERFNIPATWAVVGHLFLDPDEGQELVSQEMPAFREGWLEWNFYNNLRANPLYYGRDIVEKILASSVKHEIGLHGFFHIPFARCSQEVAETECELGIEAARRIGITPRSFVFPRDEIGHLHVLIENGLKLYRGEQVGRWKGGQNLLVSNFNWVIDKINTQPVLPLDMDGIWQVPSSMFYCGPRFPFSLWLQAGLGLSRAMRTNKVFHIWLHPHTLLLYKWLAKDLEKFIALVARKRDEGKLEVMTMGELASFLDSKG